MKTTRPRFLTSRRIHAWNLQFRYTLPWIILLLVALALPWGQA